MNLVYVRHVRCDEPRDGDFYIAPDGLTQEQFDSDVFAAQKDYLDARKAFEAMDQPPDPWITWLSQYEDPRNGVTDDMTVAQVKALRDERFAAKTAWEKARDKAAGSFSGRLRDLGYQRVSDIRTWESEREGPPEVLVAEADWGHRHGQKLAL